MRVRVSLFPRCCARLTWIGLQSQGTSLLGRGRGSWDSWFVEVRNYSTDCTGKDIDCWLEVSGSAEHTDWGVACWLELCWV